MHNENICIGIISKPIGIKGQVKVISYTESPDSLFNYNSLLLKDNTGIHFYNIKLISNNIFTAFIDNVHDRTTAEKYKLQNIYINTEELPELNNDEYYYNNLVNCKVLDVNDNLLGNVKSVLNYGAGDFLEIILTNNKEATMSFNKDAILDINIKDKVIIVDNKYLLI